MPEVPYDGSTGTSARTVDVLLQELPELAPVVAEIEDELGHRPGADLVTAELADITARLLARDRDERTEMLLESVFAAIESVARTRGADTAEAVAFGFLANLAPAALAAAAPYLHPATEQLLDAFLAGEIEPG